MKNYIVFDIGGTAVKWSIMKEDGEIIFNNKTKIAETVDMFFEKLISTINENKDKYDLQGIAISAPGAVDSKSGTIQGCCAVPYIHGPNFKEILGSTGLKVAIENDANCAAFGECWLGAAKEFNDCAFVVCGSGIGGSLIKDKRLHLGANKFGGEFGCCIVDYDKDSKFKYKNWSSVGSTTALARRVADKMGIPRTEIDGVKVFEMLESGNEIVKEEVDNYFRYMAIGIFNIQYTYDPEIIVLGGAISEGDGYIEMINDKLDEIMTINLDSPIRPKVKVCEFGNKANMIGALYNFITE